VVGGAVFTTAGIVGGRIFVGRLRGHHCRRGDGLEGSLDTGSGNRRQRGVVHPDGLYFGGTYPIADSGDANRPQSSGGAYCSCLCGYLYTAVLFQRYADGCGNEIKFLPEKTSRQFCRFAVESPGNFGMIWPPKQNWHKFS